MEGPTPANKRDEADFRALVRSLADPVRSKLLIAVSDKGGGTTIGELAKKVREPNRRVRYHLDALVDDGLVAVAGNRKRRGVVERFYRPVRLPNVSTEKMRTIDNEEAERINANVLRAIIADAGAAASAGTLCVRPGWVTVRVPAEVDPQGWDELAEIHAEALEKLQAVAENARERLAENSDEEPIDVVSALIMLEAAPWPT